MEHKEQIEGLAKAWEALGNYVIRTGALAGFWRHDWEGHCADWPGNCVAAIEDPFSTFPRGSPCFRLFAVDQDDATPCLAILRDVYGEDCDVFHIKDEDGESWSVGPVTARTLYYSTSFLSRIDAVRLALESKEREK